MEMKELESFCGEHSKFPCHIHVEGPARHSVKVIVRCGYHNQEVTSHVPYPFCRKPLACVMAGRCMSDMVCND
jgi:hypothetical protein